MKKEIKYDILNKREKRGGDIVAEQKKLLFGKNAYATIKSAKRVDRLTNASYDAAARKADGRIELRYFLRSNRWSNCCKDYCNENERSIGYICRLIFFTMAINE